MPDGISGGALMNQGFYLTLMMGRVQRVAGAAASDRGAHRRAGDVDGRQPRRLPAQVHHGRSSALALMHNSGFFDPRKRVNHRRHGERRHRSLIDGIITKQDLTPGTGAGKTC